MSSNLNEFNQMVSKTKHVIKIILSLIRVTRISNIRQKIFTAQLWYVNFDHIKLFLDS